MSSERIAEYLGKYSYGDRKAVHKNENKYELIVVVPAIMESENIKALLNSISANGAWIISKSLILIVVNNTPDAAPEVKADNLITLEFLKEAVDRRIAPLSALNIAYIDASSEGRELPDKIGGVGLARKIGMDAALQLFDFAEDKIQIIVCLDADCRVDYNYLDTIYRYFKEMNLGAGYVNFEHPVDGNDEEKHAIVCYEIFLRYYVLSLRFARSPYAFHTIGSTIVCDVNSYIKVQGMNKRKAAEDFYFIEKLSKITPIGKIEGTTVFPSGRGSWRVPFGTGQRVNRFLSGNKDEYKLYSPDSFMVLKRWNDFFLSNEALRTEYILDTAMRIDETLHHFLMENDFPQRWESILKGSKSAEQIQKQKILWFDGFRTLKFVHRMRDAKFPDADMFPTLNRMFELCGVAPIVSSADSLIPPLNDQIRYLNKLREIA